MTGWKGVLGQALEVGNMVLEVQLCPQLQQIDPEYVIPEEEVLILCIHLFF